MNWVMENTTSCPCSYCSLTLPAAAAAAAAAPPRKQKEQLLHFVSLEHNKMFLHTTTSKQWSDVLQECLDYEYCQLHLPQKIVFSMLLNQQPSSEIESDNNNLQLDPTAVIQQVDEILLLFRDLFGKEDCERSIPHQGTFHQ